MRINATNNIDFAASPHDGSPRIFLRIGWQKYTATAEEATEFARQILEAVRDLEAR